MPLGEVSERLKEHAWKACVLVTVPWVRIPPSPVGKNTLFIRIFAKWEFEKKIGSRSPAILPCELCQDRKVAAISRDLYGFGISWAFSFMCMNIWYMEPKSDVSCISA